VEPPTRGSYQHSSSSHQQRQRPSSAYAPKGGRGGVAASADQGLHGGEGMQQAEHRRRVAVQMAHADSTP
jgi:hypothetical protein